MEMLPKSSHQPSSNSKETNLLFISHIQSIRFSRHLILWSLWESVGSKNISSRALSSTYQILSSAKLSFRWFPRSLLSGSSLTKAAVFRQFSAHFITETSCSDDADTECHENLWKLFQSTRAAKHFQKDVVRGIEGIISVNAKKMEIATKLAEDCCKYGHQNPDSFLAAGAILFGNSHKLIEKERENLLHVLGEQVFNTLRTMIMGAPLEDARHLTYRYERIRQDVESQAIEVARRHLKSREASANSETMAKLEVAESRLSELKSSLTALGLEAAAAMRSVETQQQETTFQQLLATIEAERSYHENAASILNHLYAKMVEEKQRADLGSLPSGFIVSDVAQITAKPVESHPTICNEFDVSEMIVKPGGIHQNSETTLNGHNDLFIAEVVHPFDAQADGELNLHAGDFVVVRKVLESGWSEGECKGNAGWFPTAYVVRRDNAPANRLLDASSPELSDKSP